MTNTKYNDCLSIMNKPSEMIRDFTDKLTNYQKNYGLTRDTGLTLTESNFFYNCSEESIQNKDGFKTYYYSLDSDEQEMLKLLFTLMSENIFIQLDKCSNWIEIYIHRLPYQEPIVFPLPYNNSFYGLLCSYTQKAIHFDVSIDKLLLSVMRSE